MIKSFSITAFCLCLAFSAKAQLEKTIHQTFEVGEKTSISFDLISDSTLVLAWAGNTILTETKISLHDASPSILAHFTDKEHRYAIEADTSSQGILLYSTMQERKPIRTKNGECFEQVRIRVFVPENFTRESATKYVRKEDNEGRNH